MRSTLIEDRFMYTTVAFYLHTELAMTNRRFIAARPSTILGLIPVGTSRSSYPIENIAGVNAGTRFDILGVIFGAAALLVGVSALSISGAQSLAVVLILLGAAAIAGAPKQFVEVMNSGGGTIKFPVSVFERGRTLEFASRVSETIARSSRGARSARDGERPVAASTDATGALRQLDQLRTQGLITEAEFAAKRQDVLNRL
jgi:Short C-terminal domain